MIRGGRRAYTQFINSESYIERKEEVIFRLVVEHMIFMLRSELLNHSPISSYRCVTISLIETKKIGHENYGTVPASSCRCGLLAASRHLLFFGIRATPDAQTPLPPPRIRGSSDPTGKLDASP